MTFSEEEDEDTLVEEGLQIERGTVFLRDPCHREMYPRNIRDKATSRVSLTSTWTMSKWRKTL